MIAAVFLAFCCAFNANTPYRKPGVLMHQLGPDGQKAPVPDVGAPDERQHANYVSGLLQGNGFPVLKPGDPNLYESYQAHQPPLYYVLAAGWCKVTGSDPSSSNGFAFRFLNTLIGLVTMVGIGFGAWWGFGKRSLALAAPAVMLMPMVVALHSAASNDPLLYCLCTWTIALLALVLRTGWVPKTCLWIGVLTGLAFLTKTTSLALVPVIGFALAASVREETRKPNLAAIGMVCGVPLLIAGGWWVRNMSLYGDPFAMTAFKAAFTGSPQAQNFIDAFGAKEYWLNWVLWWTARSFIGTFGYSDIFMFESLGAAKSVQTTLSLSFVLIVLALMGSLAMGQLKDDKPGKRFAWVGVIFGATVIAFFVSFNKQYFQGQARYLYPAIAPISWLLSGGVCLLLGKNRLWSWAVVCVALGALDLVALNEVVAGFALRVTA